MLKRFLFLIFFFPTIAFSQLLDDFEDADITNWQESTIGHWEASSISPLNGAYSLYHIFDNSEAGKDQISVALSKLDLNADSTIWRFKIKYNYNPSDGNNWSVFLVSDADAGNMIPGGNINGYAIAVNFTGSDDILKLLRLDSGSSTIVISTSLNWDSDTYPTDTIALEIVRTKSANWEVFFNSSGDFANLISLGTGTDNTYSFADYFGVYYDYTSSADRLLWLDDIEIIGDVYVDTIPPIIDSLNIISANEIYLEFNEEIDSVTATNFLNYSINNGIENPDSIYFNTNNNAVNLFFDNELNNKSYYNLTVTNLEDLWSNSMLDTSLSFLYFVPEPFDLIINEFMADPNPEVNLPNYEYIEIFNTTKFQIDLTGWKFKVGSSVRTFTNQLIDSAEHITLCSTTAAEFLDDYGNVIDFSSFPVITNSGTSIVVFDEDNMVIDSIDFDVRWYSDTEKEDGGWSIEKIDPLNNCSQITNWKASEDVNGGTPGQKNSVFDSNIDIEAPLILELEVISNNELKIRFNESFEQVSVNEIGNYSVNNDIGNPDSIAFNLNNYEVNLFFLNAFVDGQNYILTVESISDFCGNIMNTTNTDFIYYKSKPFDIVVNEIFADPDPVVGLPEFEFIEIYNTSDFDLDLSGWQLKVGTSIKNFPDSILNPKSYLILCSSASQDYYKSFGALAVFSSFPAIPNSGDAIVLYNDYNEIIDSIYYTQDWYNNSEKEDGGWTIERIDYLNTCSGISNWKASEDIKGGTPGAENSVYESNIDQEAPQIEKVEIISGNQLKIYFNEPLTKESILDKSNYNVNQGIGNPFSVSASNNLKEVDLLFLNSFPEMVDLILSTENLRDNCGNSSSLFEYNFLYYIVQPYDIVINEIMADPDPVVGLPEFEYLEIYNSSEYSINLKSWILTIGSTIKTLDEKLIGPNEYLILSSSNADSALQQYGDVLVVSGFPSLANTEQTIILQNPKKEIISRMTYSNEWYNNEYKAEGGWSLEQIDPLNPCGEEDNWSASESVMGGSPGQENSVYKANPDIANPELLRIAVQDENTIQLFFTESIDSLSAMNENIYLVDQDIGNPISINFVNTDYKSLFLEFANNFELNRMYELEILGGITDCSGNEIIYNNSARFSIPQIPHEKDIVINEVLFNPLPNNYDFIEIYNRSEKTIDLNKILITSYDNDKLEYSEIKQISQEGYLIFPYEYVVLTENPESVQNQYTTSNPEGFIKVENLPAYSDDHGRVILLDLQQNFIDDFEYDENMHFALLATNEGVSLERINFDRASDDKSNWHSASELVGFATPAYENSQYTELTETKNNIEVEPEVFSPDNDGFEDFANINFNFNEPGYVANIKIYDSKGRLIRYLTNNQLLGVDGIISWDGLDDNNQKAPVGIYVVFIEIFDLDGNVKQYKKSVVLAAKW